MLLPGMVAFAQGSYEDSAKKFIDNYVQTHGVVKGADKAKMYFYPVNKAYCVTANFTPSTKNDWISFKTSGKLTKTFKLYGTLSFVINSKPYRLNLYQSQELMTSAEYKNYLFLPFTDSTTGIDTYPSGRYIDLTTEDIKAGKLRLDFNKAYNPYCAYVSGVYNCPIPPKENALPVAINAGEKSFSKAH